jgi:hypothetical protein
MLLLSLRGLLFRNGVLLLSLAGIVIQEQYYAIVADSIVMQQAHGVIFPALTEHKTPYFCNSLASVCYCQSHLDITIHEKYIKFCYFDLIYCMKKQYVKVI